MTDDPESAPLFNYNDDSRFNLRAIVDYSPTSDLAAPDEKNGLRAFLGEYGVELPPEKSKDENADPLAKLRSYLNRSNSQASSRFSDGSFPVVYMGDEDATCLAEVEHHLENRLKNSAAPKIKTHYFVLTRFALTGPTLDVRSGYPALHNKNDWGPAQTFGAVAKTLGHQGITFNAVRRLSSESVAVFKAELVRGGTRIKILGLRWNGTRVVLV